MRATSGALIILAAGALAAPGTASAEPGALVEHYAQAETTTSLLGAPVVPEESTDQAISTLKRISGLTWQQVADLFGVSRRAAHFWASGEKLSPDNEDRLRQTLATVRFVSRGAADANRALLLEERDGERPIDLLARQDYDHFRLLLGRGPGGLQPMPTPLSPDAQTSRRPLAPEVLVGALQDTVHTEVGRARPVRTVRIKRRGGD